MSRRTRDATTPGNQAVVPFYIGRRNVEGGGRQDTFRTDSFRGVLGVRGAISENWSYDAAAQFSKVKVENFTLNRFHLTRFQNAMRRGRGSRFRHGRSRSAAPRSTGRTRSCVPYNVFDLRPDHGRGARPTCRPRRSRSGAIEQEIYGASVTGDLGGIGLASPLANDSIKVVFGVETRTDRLETLPDSNLQGVGGTSLLMGQGGATTPVDGSVKVDDLFTEIRIPLLNDLPFAAQLSIDGAYRYSDYDTLSTDTYKIGLDWAPIDDVRFRGSFQRAVRAANIVELFSAQSFNLFDIAGDPCGAQSADGVDRRLPRNRRAREQHRVGEPGQPGGPVPAPAGRQSRAQPEESDTTTFGVILQPRFAPKLAVSIDYFDIEIQDTVSTFGPSNSLNACYVNDDPDCMRANQPQCRTVSCGSVRVTSRT